MSGPDPLMMGRTIVDRAAHHRTDPDWLASAWAQARVVRVSEQMTTPVFADGAITRLTLVGADEVDAGVDRWFLGVDGDVPYFAVLAAANDGWLGIRDIGPVGDRLELDLLVTAVALIQWHLRHTHCPRCGAETQIEQAGWTRHCPVDNTDHFPRTDPAVIMLVHDGDDRCLLGRGAVWPPGRYSTLAGFVEPGEALESAVIREVFEEVGVVVGDVRYVASQPWPFPSSLMLGFMARADGAAEVRPDKVEMAEAGWFTRDEVRQAADWTDAARPIDPRPGVLQAIPGRLSISRYLIDSWLTGS
jgi:NAD+ diphosphatase